ncbi:MAG: DUF2290 domain-containing protein [Proteobacteria bacterium]|nr:DUF2290 domain-containing protein [Pseudomonadota bacterium]
MNSDVVRNQIESFVNFALRAGFAIDANPVLKLTSNLRNRITWSNNPRISDSFGKFATLDEYVAFVTRRDYNILLYDYSFIQLCYEFNRSEIVGHRLCYYPCPITFESSDFDNFNILELISLLDGEAWQQRLRLRSPVRFDFDKKAVSLEHPASHFTICEDSCRIPVHAPLSVGHFVKFITRHFYPTIWKDHGEALAEIGNLQWNVTDSVSSVDELSLRWRRPD